MRSQNPGKVVVPTRQFSRLQAFCFRRDATGFRNIWAGTINPLPLCVCPVLAWPPASADHGPFSVSPAFLAAPHSRFVLARVPYGAKQQLPALVAGFQQVAAVSFQKLPCLFRCKSHANPLPSPLSSQPCPPCRGAQVCTARFPCGQFFF